MVSAGVGLALGALTTKFAADALGRSAWAAACGWIVLTGLASGTGLLNEMRALQRRAVVEVGPVGMAIQTLVPVGCAPILFGEALGSTAFHGLVLGAGVAALVGAAACLTRAPAVIAWEGAASTESGTGVAPERMTELTAASSARSEPAEPSTTVTRTSPRRGSR